MTNNNTTYLGLSAAVGTILATIGLYEVAEYASWISVFFLVIGTAVTTLAIAQLPAEE